MSSAVISEPIAQLQRQLNEFRSTQPRGRKLPESVWQAAVELAREHGVYSVAHPLRLDYSNKYVTLQLLWEEYRQSQPEGYRYSRFCELYRRWHWKQDVVLRQEHRAGEKMFVDWAGRPG